MLKHSSDVHGLCFHFINLTKFNVGTDGFKQLKSCTDIWFFYLKHIYELNNRSLHDFETNILG